MVKKSILDRISCKDLTADEAAEVVLKDFKILPDIFKGVTSENKRIKNATAKILRTVSYEHPDKLYTKFDFFVSQMNGDDTILKWNAMDTIANMAPVDKKNKLKKVLPTYYDLLSDDVMITAAHAVEGLGVIAKHQPQYQNEITKQLSRVRTIKRNAECKNILLGKVILAYGGYVDQVSNKKDMISLAKGELKNGRPATRKKAEKFLEKNK